MRRILAILHAGDGDARRESAAPPHPERPAAAAANPDPRGTRRVRAALRSRTVRLVVAVASLALLASACAFDVGPHPTSAAPAATPPGTPPIAHWLALAQCETGGNWSAPGPTYVGGLGMYGPNWAAHGGLQYAPAANLATPQQQIAVATNLWLSGGTWGCRIGDGWDHR
jgi:hypothetical protein